jgi:hypothetical protein
VQAVRDWMMKTGVETGDNYNIQSIRARRLTEELIKIGEQVPIFDCPDLDQEAAELNEFARLFKPIKRKKERSVKARIHTMGVNHIRETIDKMKRLSGVKEVAHHTLEDLDSETKFGQLSGEDYADIRLDVYLDLFEREADAKDWLLLFYKVATYFIGAVSGFLSYMGLQASDSSLSLR